MRTSRRRKREAFDFPNRRLRFFSSSSLGVIPLSIDRRRSTLREFEDRRLYHPEGVQAPARSFISPRHRLTTVDRIYSRKRFHTPSVFFSRFQHPSQTRATIAFSNPRKTLICVRRKIRREVIHALGKAGKNGARRLRRTPYSEISCRS